MNKQELVKALAKETQLTQVAVNKVLNALEGQVITNLQEGVRTQLTGFLTVKPAYRAARKGYDPIKKEAMDIDPTVGVSVKPGEKLKAAVKGLKVEDFAPAETAE
jgi:DNA-binding protein HU-beta